MSRKKKKQRRKEKIDAKWELRSDKRTADYIARRLEESQDELADLLPDLRVMKRYDEIEQLGWALSRLEWLRTRCRKFAEGGHWDETC